jgi:hypothetical protein
VVLPSDIRRPWFLRLSYYHIAVQISYFGILLVGPKDFYLVAPDVVFSLAKIANMSSFDSFCRVFNLDWFTLGAVSSLVNFHVLAADT